MTEIIVTLTNGDWAEPAEASAEAIMLTARTLWEDATEGRYGGRCRDLTASVTIDGKIVMAGINRAAMLAAA